MASEYSHFSVREFKVTFIRFTSFSTVSIVDFELANVCWAVTYWILNTNKYPLVTYII